ncbi:Serine/threonine-protein kinase pkn1 [Roseimaritima multifibrata]|uniref:Serine/threonine-protein kinase pkn1 n=1 Tax=Roseimaritima multifibrata TaxID=1930274 RepID=A0A517MLR3_9BACT|nr:SUMF1/EgtB/PvdO family nonheme iron enzyme [Roseimaritima multifibrata]QDS95845.1 Serine/threonine-protein kinase pkn1 [Roseimaritima multifibrata]
MRDRTSFLTILLTAVATLGLGGWVAAEETPGISKEKPAEGPFVEVKEGYMVPYTTRIPGSDVTFEMVPIPGGTYMLGSPESDPAHKEDEGPQVKVTIDPIWVARHEITWDEYDQYMNLYYTFKEFQARGIRPVDPEQRADVITSPTELYQPDHTYEYGKEPDEPAITMTQYAAKQYTKWLSAITGQQFRLPSEAEWEYACRAGTETPYNFGDSADDLDANAWFFDNAEEGVVKVGQKKPNAFGLYDMHGNAAEWVVDGYTEDGYKSLAGKELNGINAVQWPTSAYPRVVRGGSWESDPEDLRSTSRMGSQDPEWKEEDPNFPKSPWWFTSDPARGVGFRIVRSYQPLAPETISKFWEAVTEDEIDDIESRLREGRGGLGKVDKGLTKAIEDWKASQ